MGLETVDNGKYLELIENYDRFIEVLQKQILNKDDTISYLKNELRIATINNNRV